MDHLKACGMPYYPRRAPPEHGAPVPNVPADSVPTPQPDTDIAVLRRDVAQLRDDVKELSQALLDLRRALNTNADEHRRYDVAIDDLRYSINR